MDAEVTVQGWTAGGRAVDVVAARSQVELERAEELAREHQQALQRNAEEVQAAQRAWAARREDLRAAVAAAERVREALRIHGPDVLGAEELAAVQKAALVVAAGVLVDEAQAALAAHERVR